MPLHTTTTRRGAVVGWLLALVVGVGALLVPTTASAATTTVITGVVSGPQGPIAGALVFVSPYDDSGPANAVETDASGRYTFPVLPGSYRMRFDAVDLGFDLEYYDNATTHDAATPVSVSAGQRRTVNVTLAVSKDAPGTMSGRVVDPSGAPLGGATVVASGAHTLTAADGTWTLSVRPGTHTIRFGSPEDHLSPEFYKDAYTNATATSVTVRPGAAVTGLHAALNTVGRIEGVITRAGGVPVAGAQINVSSEAGNLWSGPTDAQGRYSARAPLGPVTVCVTPPAPFVKECWLDAAEPYQGQRLTISSGQVVKGIDIEVGTVTQVRFTDVPNTHLFARHIYSLQGTGVINGYADGTFRPEDTTTRAATAAFLYRIAGKPSFTPPKTSPFKDVPTSHQFYKEITWMHATGITTGYVRSNGVYFEPDGTANREQAAAFLYRLAGKPSFTPPKTSPFKDVTTSHPFYKEITWLHSVGVTTGTVRSTGVYFEPSGQLSRGAIAAFLVRARDGGLVSPR